MYWASVLFSFSRFSLIRSIRFSCSISRGFNVASVSVFLYSPAAAFFLTFPSSFKRFISVSIRSISLFFLAIFASLSSVHCSWTFFFSASSFFIRDVSVFIFSLLVPVNEVAVASVLKISLLIWAIADSIPAKSFCVVCRAFNWLVSFSVPNKRLILAVRLFRLYPDNVFCWRVSQ